jgi:hypothetical protein
MADELDALSVTETDQTASIPVDATPDLSAGGETVTETPDLSASPDVGATAQPEWRGIRDILPEHGFDNSQFADDQQAVKFLLEQTQRARQYEPYVQQVQQHWTAFQQYLAQQNKPVAPAQPAETPKSYWDKPPEYDPQWASLVQRNEQGQLVAIPGAQPDLPQKVQAYAKWREQQLSKLLQDPVEATWGGIEQKLGDVIKPLQEQIQQLKAERVKESVNRYVLDNAQYLFQFDQNTGKPLIDPTTGQPAFSPYGQAFSHYLNQAEQLGIPSTAQREQYARQLAVAYVQGQPQPQQAQQAVPDANAQHKAAFVANGAKRIPNRGGTVNVAAESDSVSQNGSHDLRDMLYGSFRKAGLIDATAT